MLTRRPFRGTPSRRRIASAVISLLKFRFPDPVGGSASRKIIAISLRKSYMKRPLSWAKALEDDWRLPSLPSCPDRAILNWNITGE
jgi:hypothetical protein